MTYVEQYVKYFSCTEFEGSLTRIFVCSKQKMIRMKLNASFEIVMSARVIDSASAATLDHRNDINVYHRNGINVFVQISCVFSYQILVYFIAICPFMSLSSRIPSTLIFLLLCFEILISLHLPTSLGGFCDSGHTALNKVSSHILIKKY